MLIDMVFSPRNARLTCSLMNVQWRLMAVTNISFSLVVSSDSAISTHCSPFRSIQIFASEC